MTLVLHSYRRCPFAIRVRMTLEEKHLPYEVIEEDLSALSADLLRLHPEGKVPLLIHEGVAIPESDVITEYLDELFPEPPLRPAAPLERARVRLWTHWCSNLFKPDLDAFKYGLKALSEAEQGALVERLRGHLGKLEEALATKPFLMGDRLTLADIHVFPFYRQLTRARSEIPGFFQAVQADAWLERITRRPSFERAMVKR